MTATAASRAAAFADRVRRRVAARPGGRIGRGIGHRGAWPAGRSRRGGEMGASTVQRVLRSEPRTWPQRSAASGRIDVRIALALRLAGGGAAVGTGVRTRPLQVMQLRRGIHRQPVAGTRDRPASTRPAVTALRWEGEDGRRASAESAAWRRRQRTPSAPPAIVLRHARRTIGGGAARRTSGPTPPIVPLVHRTASASPASSVPPADRATSSASVHWSNAAPGAAAPLTSADLPQVIERVVGEIDRRVTAARERRGWTA